jgi:hypothetical protein
VLAVRTESSERLPPSSTVRCRRNRTEAVLCFQQSIEINPNRLMNYIKLGLTYAQMGKSSDARAMPWHIFSEQSEVHDSVPSRQLIDRKRLKIMAADEESARL